MAFFEWQDSFSVNVAKIDEQHRKLIVLVSNLNEAIERSNELATLSSVVREFETVASVLDEMMDYASYHFETEESYMREHGYPEHRQHEAQHREFAEQVHAFKDRLEKRKTRLSIDVAQFIRQWWQTHILGPDKRLGVFLSTKGVA